MPVTGIGSAAATDAVASLVDALEDATAAVVAANGDKRYVDTSDIGYDVIVIAGQSNATGTNGTPDTTYLDPPDPRILRWVNPGTSVTALAPYRSTISAAFDPLGNNDTLAGVGPGMPFAREYVRSIPTNRRVLLVPCARGSTPLVTTTPPTWNSTVSGSLLTGVVTVTAAAVAAAGSNARVVAFLWVQGETDAQNSVSGASYQTALDALIAAFRAHVTTATSSTPFIIGSMVPTWVNTPNGTSLAIAAAHAATPARVAYTGYVAGPNGTGNIHYVPSEQRTIGAAMFTAYQAALTNTLTPGVPAKVTIVAADASSGQVAVSWLAPGSVGSSITDYTVQYRTTSGPGAWSTFSHAVSAATTQTVTGLTNGTSYDFQVAAVNASGTGTYSDAATATPFVPTVAGTPTGLVATAGDTQALLSWTAPANNGNSTITDYTIQYRTPSGSGSWSTWSHTASTATTATITGLTNGSVYGFQVAAVNAVGTGAYTGESTATPSIASFNPDSISGLLSWFTADSISTRADGASVTSWADSKSGIALVTAGSSPTYRATAINGKPAVQFVASSTQGLGNGSSTLSIGNSYTSFLVCSINTATVGQQQFLTYMGTTSGTFQHSWVAGFASGNVSWFDNTLRTVGTWSNGTWAIWEVVNDDTGNTSDKLKNGTSAGSGTALSQKLNTAQVVYLGRANSSANYADMTMAELLVYNTALGSSTRSTLRSYLGAKYGITVT